jgi:hypothetical protein
VNAPSAVTTTPDEEAQSAYYENISNFLTAIEEIGLPTFDLYDLDEVIFNLNHVKMHLVAVLYCVSVAIYAGRRFFKSGEHYTRTEGL